MKTRNVPGHKILDPSTIANQSYNEKAGAQKNTEVGRKLIPIKIGAGYTCDATTRRALPGAGKNLAIYNNSGSMGTVTTGGAAVTSLAAGVADADGKVGVPCLPNDWTYLAAGEDTHVISSAATLLVFVIDDESSITGSN